MAIDQGILNGSTPSFLLFADAAAKKEAASSKTIDTWLSSKYWYGRLVKTSKVPLAAIPEHEAISQFPSKMASGGAQFALNFVVAALTSAWEKYRALVGAGKLPEDLFTVARAYSDPEEEFSNYISSHVYPILEDYLETNGKVKKVNNFDAFLEQFTLFGVEYLGIMPITFTSFIASRFYSPLNSGLVLDMKLLSTDPNNAPYRSFVKLMNNFGFFVDANNPSRIYADVGHPVMQEKMKEAGFDAESGLEFVMKDFLRPVSSDEASRLSDLVATLYANWRSGHPSFTTHEECGTDLVSNKFTLPPATLLSEERVLSIYFFVRSKEFGVGYSQKQFDAKLRQVVSLYQRLGMQYALSNVETRYPVAGMYLKGDAKDGTIGEQIEVANTFYLS